MPRFRMLALAAAALAVLTAIVVAVTAARTGEHSDSTADSTPSSATAHAAGNGATGFADPTTDRYGRKVLSPLNPAGQPLPQREPGARAECGGTPPSSPEQVAIEKSFGLPILVSATDGPTRVDDTLLTGYRRTPQGASLAGWNFLARVYAGGAPMRAAIEAATVLPAGETLPPAASASSPVSRPERFRAAIAAPDGFRVLSCDADFVALEWAVRLDIDDTGTPVTGPQWIGVRLNLLWRGDWKAQTTRDPTSLASGQRYTSLEGWTRWSM